MLCGVGKQRSNVSGCRWAGAPSELHGERYEVPVRVPQTFLALSASGSISRFSCCPCHELLVGLHWADNRDVYVCFPSAVIDHYDVHLALLVLAAENARQLRLPAFEVYSRSCHRCDYCGQGSHHSIVATDDAATPRTESGMYAHGVQGVPARVANGGDVGAGMLCGHRGGNSLGLRGYRRSGFRRGGCCRVGLGCSGRRRCGSGGAR